MNLSWLKWPIVGLVVLGAFWLVSSGGVNYMYNNFTRDTPGVDAAKDASNEAGLTRLGNFLLKTLRYDMAEKTLRTAVERYPQGANVYLNYYRLVKLAEKRGDYREAVAILEDLIALDAHARDDRVPPNENLRMRADTLAEVHEMKSL